MGSASPGAAAAAACGQAPAPGTAQGWGCGGHGQDAAGDGLRLACGATAAHGCIAGRGGLQPLTDEECADVLLVNAVIRGELADVRRALATGADPGTVADLALRTAEPQQQPPRPRPGTAGPPGRPPALAGHRSDGTTPLMRAAALGHADIVWCLLEAGASLEDRDCRGWTPICHALGAGEVELARALHSRCLAAGAADGAAAAVLRQRQVLDARGPELLEHCAVEVGEAAAELVRLELAALLLDGERPPGPGPAAIFGGKKVGGPPPAAQQGAGAPPAAAAALLAPRSATAESGGPPPSLTESLGGRPGTVQAQS